MADYPANDLTNYLLEIPAVHKELLGQIRHWNNLKAAFDAETLWIKEITAKQAESVLIIGLPFTKIYYIKQGLLFLKGSLLPARKLPQGLLWSPLPYAIPVVLPPFNHNYFGISQKIPVIAVPSQLEQPVFAMLSKRTIAGKYIHNAPKVRLSRLKWVGIDDDLLIIGTPLLPIEGKTFWLYDDFLLPSGYDFELPVLAKKLKQQIDPDSLFIVLWHNNNTFVSVDKLAFMELSRSSFRLTYSEE